MRCGLTTHTLETVAKHGSQLGHEVNISTVSRKRFGCTIFCVFTVKEGLWIGLYSETTGLNQYSYKWLSNSMATYTNWAPAQPYRNTAKCGTLFVSDSTLSNYQHRSGQWGMIPCSYKQSYICKRPADRITSTTTPNTPGCPPVTRLKLQNAHLTTFL